MAVGKYSPTVSRSYMNDRHWWRSASAGNAADPDGYDSYGYSQDGDGPDRAGNTELDYLEKWDEIYGYYLYNETAREWQDKVINFKK